MNKEKIIKAGAIAREIKLWVKPLIKKGMPLIEIAELIENKTYELGGEPAFPVNLSINEYAAHYTPAENDETLAHGLMKVDFGVHVDGWIADNAFSVDMEGTEENKKLIKASKLALTNIEQNISSEITIGEIGKIAEDAITSLGFHSVANLSGHSMEQYNLHAGISIPNITNDSDHKLGEVLCACEPFATNGNGIVHDGPKGGIYAFIQDKQPRSPIARQVLNFIKDNYGTLPFAGRWITKKFGSKGKLGLFQLERVDILHQYSILTETKGKLVSQTENTFLIEKDKVTITSKED